MEFNTGIFGLNICVWAFEKVHKSAMRCRVKFGIEHNGLKR